MKEFYLFLVDVMQNCFKMSATEAELFIILLLGFVATFVVYFVASKLIK